MPSIKSNDGFENARNLLLIRPKTGPHCLRSGDSTAVFFHKDVAVRRGGEYRERVGAIVKKSVSILHIHKIARVTPSPAKSAFFYNQPSAGEGVTRAI
jgi:hypothetical protein